MKDEVRAQTIGLIKVIPQKKKLYQTIFFNASLECFDFSNLKEIICTPKLCNKKFIDHHDCSKAKDPRSSLLVPWIEKQYRVLGMPARLFALLRDYYTQYRMCIVITAIIIYKLKTTMVRHLSQITKPHGVKRKKLTSVERLLSQLNANCADSFMTSPEVGNVNV